MDDLDFSSQAVDASRFDVPPRPQEDALDFSSDAVAVPVQGPPKPPRNVPVSASEPTYFGEATKGLMLGLAQTLGLGAEGAAGLSTTNPQSWQDVAAQLPYVKNMSDQDFSTFRHSLSQRLAPAAAFQLQRAITQLRRGTVSKLEDSPQYTSAMELMNPQGLDDNPFYKWGSTTMDRASKDFAAAPGWEDSASTQLSQGVGSTLPFMGIGMIGKAVEEATGLAGALPKAIGGGALAQTAEFGNLGAGLAVSAGTQMDDAKQFLEKQGVDPNSDKAEQIMLNAATVGAPVGLTENTPVEFLIDRLSSKLPGLRTLKDTTLKGKLVKTLGKMISQAVVEGGQEGGQQVYQNFIAQMQYDPDRKLDDQVLQSALVGAGVGAGMEGATSLVHETWNGGRGKKSEHGAETEQEAPAPAGNKRLEPPALAQPDQNGGPDDKGPDGGGPALFSDGSKAPPGYKPVNVGGYALPAPPDQSGSPDFSAAGEPVNGTGVRTSPSVVQSDADMERAREEVKDRKSVV